MARSSSLFTPSVQVKSQDKWKDEPTKADQVDADELIAAAVLKSLENRYTKDPDWKDPATAPIIVRKNRAAAKNKVEEEKNNNEEPAQE